MPLGNAEIQVSFAARTEQRVPSDVWVQIPTEEGLTMILALALVTFACVLAAAVIDLRNTPRPALARAGSRDTSNLLHAQAPVTAAPPASAHPAPVR